MALDNIFIGVITYKRPKGLQRLLEGLAALRFTEPHPPVTVIVVDNDATGAMEPLVDAMRPGFPWTLQYAVHPEAGIPFARNRVVQETGGRDGVLIFIDDDEIPEPDWADRLLAKYRATGAEAILGPVAPIYETPPEDWIVQGKFFGKTFSGTGEVPYGSTANVLIDMKVFNGMGLSFDPRLRFTGGEDTLLFMQMKKKGGRMLWEPGALVSETVPTSRANAKWLISRKFREGNTFILAEKLAGASLGRQAGLLLSGLMRAVGGALLSLVSLSGPTEKRVDARARMMRGLGMLNAFAGRRYDEYKKIHGS